MLVEVCIDSAISEKMNRTHAWKHAHTHENDNTKSIHTEANIKASMAGLLDN